MRILSGIAVDEPARSVQLKLENPALTRPARGDGTGKRTRCECSLEGADDPEVTAWMRARAQARKQNFFRWCRRLQRITRRARSGQSGK